MRRAILIFFVVISMILLLSGCAAKSYLFDFTVEPDLARNDGIWTTASANFELTPSKGLILKGIWAAAPHYYDGDFNVEHVFELKENDTYHRGLYLVISSDVHTGDAEWYGGLRIMDEPYTSGDFHITYIQGQYSIATLIPITTSVPVSQILVYPGENTVNLQKTGNLLSIKLNGVKLGTGLEISGYNLDWFCPVIATYYETMAPWDLVIYKSMEVLFKGRQVLTY
ncbi:MAG: hypothetical protein KBB09_05980 [Firmicutes bacterium]|nr:hypothetical protein [Bacillota bacterium]